MAPALLLQACFNAGLSPEGWYWRVPRSQKNGGGGEEGGEKDYVDRLTVNVLALLLCCLMSSDVSWHIRDKLRPMPKHCSILLYVHGNRKAR